MTKKSKILFLLFFLLDLVIVFALLYRFGTQYESRYTFDDRIYKKVDINENANANRVQFKSGKVKADIKNSFKGKQISDIHDLISHCLKITNKSLFYDTSTLLNRKNTDLSKVNHQHDVDWLYENGHANCIGYAYLFAGVFNEIKSFCPNVDSCDVRIIYESPLRLLFGLFTKKHTWNEVIVHKKDRIKKIYIDANAADYFLPGDVTKLN